MCFEGLYENTFYVISGFGVFTEGKGRSLRIPAIYTAA